VALGLLALYLGLFEVWPVLGVIGGAFAGSHGLTLANLATSVSSEYQSAFGLSFTVAAISAVTSAIIGLPIAWYLGRERGQTILSRTVESYSAISANFAGVPLAFAFAVTLGPEGLFTNLLAQWLHVQLYNMGFNLVGPAGLVVVYSDFQVPLFVLLLTPAMRNLRAEWAEAHATLGGSPLDYLRYVLVPVLAPTVLGVLTLLFANAFGAYVTAYALTTGNLNLVPLLIGDLVNGNVTINVALGDALTLDMVVVLILAVVVYRVATRRSQAWLR
jgi:putative spermidine/putrescine transport system permease protein